MPRWPSASAPPPPTSPPGTWRPLRRVRDDASRSRGGPVRGAGGRTGLRARGGRLRAGDDHRPARLPRRALDDGVPERRLVGRPRPAAQPRREPRTLVTWVGDPAPGATNERPHVFDIGRLPARAVYVRGTARFMDDATTVDCYARHVARQRAQGFTRAPLRDADQVRSDLAGVHLEPYRVRLEGFGTGAQSFDWTLSPPDRPRPVSPPQGET